MTLLDGLHGRLIVSVQARAGSALDEPGVLAAMAAAAAENGAAGLRAQGVANLRAIRARVALPIIGIIKRDYAGYEPYITPTLREVREVLCSGAQIVAFDATQRARPQATSVAQLVEAIHAGGALAMADCASAADGARAKAAGADVLATTLCGYTKETQGHVLPALDLVGELARLNAFVICEGGIHAPQSGRAALDAGADAVVVGTAITNIEWLTQGFAAALAQK